MAERAVASAAVLLIVAVCFVIANALLPAGWESYHLLP
jgi:hypothetical protein